jgi:hypothetical protein
MRASLSRYFRVLLYAACCLGLLFAMHPFLPTLGRATSAFWSQYPSGYQFYLAMLVTALASWLIVERKAFSIAHLAPRNLLLQLRYPPVLLAVLLAVAAYSFVSSSHGAAFPPQDWLIGFALLLAIVAVLGALSVAWQRLTVAETVDRGQKDTRTSSSFQSWLQNEYPITDASEDLFGHDLIAERILGQLKHERLYTVALVGAFGAGKSSIFRLFHRKLAADAGRGTEMLWTCTAASWGFETAEATAESLLEAAVAEVARHVDALAVSPVPREYSALLGLAQSGWLSGVSEFLSHKDNPVESLRRFDELLEAVGSRLLFVIEDLDRNPWPIQPLAATLDRLRHMKRISFLVAVGSDTQLDLARLCERIERVPDLAPERVWQALLMLKDICIAPDPLHESPARSATSDVRSMLRPWDEVRFREALFEDRAPVTEAFARLLTTPRQLKSALRRTWEAWQALRGECEFEDVLLLNTLRLAAPEAFNFIERHSRDLYALESDNPDRRSSAVTRISGAWSELRQRVTWDASSADTLITLLFPRWPKEGVGYSFGISPQNVATDARYLSRILSESMAPSEVRDQQVLSSIREWRVRTSEALVTSLCSSQQFTDVFEALQNTNLNEEFLLPCHELEHLAGAVFALTLSRDGVRAHEHTAPGFIALWRLAAKRCRSVDPGFLREQIGRAIPVSLRFALAIEYYWASSRRAGLLSEEEAKAIRAGFSSLVRSELATPQALASSLDPTYAWSLNHLIRHQYDEHVLDPSEDWSPTGLVALEAAQLQPNVIPHLAMLVATSTRSSATTQYHLDQEFVDKLFPDARTRRQLWHLLSLSGEYPELDDQAREAMRQLREDSLRQQFRPE